MLLAFDIEQKIYGIFGAFDPVLRYQSGEIRSSDVTLSIKVDVIECYVW